MKSEKYRMHGQGAEGINENISNSINVEVVMGHLEFCKSLSQVAITVHKLEKLNSCTSSIIPVRETPCFIKPLHVMVVFSVVRDLFIVF